MNVRSPAFYSIHRRRSRSGTFSLRRFAGADWDLYSENDETFIEKYGRKFFLLYLKPIIKKITILKLRQGMLFEQM